jgi:hypothetical protein
MSALTPAALAEEKSFSIGELCLLENITTSSYYKLRKKGFGPREMRLPGSSIVRISAESRRAWHKKLEELNANDGELAREKEARAAQASRAGKKSVTSTAHPCRRRKSKG